jgi:hypothetical protein
MACRHPVRHCLGTFAWGSGEFTSLVRDRMRCSMALVWSSMCYPWKRAWGCPINCKIPLRRSPYKHYVVLSIMGGLYSENTMRKARSKGTLYTRHQSFESERVSFMRDVYFIWHKK